MSRSSPVVYTAFDMTPSPPCESDPCSSHHTTACSDAACGQPLVFDRKGMHIPYQKGRDAPPFT